MTSFQILTRDDSGSWRERGTEEAHNAKSACERSYLKDPDGAVTAIVAVPSRSWRPQPIRLEERPPKVVFGGDDGPTEAEVEADPHEKPEPDLSKSEPSA